jgi:adenylate kinase
MSNEKTKPKIAVMFMGKPGAGKGTQADFLVEKYGLKHFNTGDEIRHRVYNPQNEEDKKERDIYNSGQLNSFPWVANLVTQASHKYFEDGEGLVFSGSPRSLFEAEKLVPQLINDYGKENVVAILLDVDDEDSIVRNSKRITCDQCGFTMGLTQAMEDGIEPIPTQCPKCGGTLIKRVLDSEEKIRNERLPAYKKNTEPVLDYMRQQEILREVDGRPSPETVYLKVLEIISPMAEKF